MSQNPASGSTPKEETTFRSFTKDQGNNYARFRRDYHARLYNTIIDYHSSKGGEFNLLLDLGCGPGISVRSFGTRFKHAIGVDASEGMIATAKSLGGETSTSEPIRFEVSKDYGASLDPPIEDGSVDVITIATAAHWFDMAAFWTQAARMLKPGGTVALWVSANGRAVAPTPKAEEVTSAIRRLIDRLADYFEEGNKISRDLYRNLPLPWTIETPVPEFEESEFRRQEWGTGAVDSFPGNEYYAIHPPANLDMIEMVMSTGSPIIRWREAHPELVGTEQDLVRRMRREIEEILWGAGVKKGEEVIHGGMEGVMLLFRKRA